MKWALISFTIAVWGTLFYIIRKEKEDDK